MSQETRVIQKSKDLERWEKSVKSLISSSESKNPNEVAKKIKKLKGLLTVYSNNRQWWDNDIDSKELHDAHTLKKMLVSELHNIENHYRTLKNSDLNKKRDRKNMRKNNTRTFMIEQ